MSDIVERLLAGTLTQPGNISPTCVDVDVADVLMVEAAGEITRLRQLLSEADKREREARGKVQAMHRRAQESERVEQMIQDTLGGWYSLYLEGRFKNRSRRGLFYAVMKELKTKAEKVRAKRSALQSEDR